MWKAWRIRRLWVAWALLTAQNACLALTLLTLALASTASAQSEKRYVPQLGLSVLSPKKVAFHLSRDDLLLVVNDDGRIDLLNIPDPNRLLKIGEIFASATDAAFSPKGDWIVSGGRDGTVRLWQLDGTPAAAPFKGHEAAGPLVGS